MAPRMTIGDFSRATRLSAKTLRFYHQTGLLQPAHIDPHNGYREYETAQIADAQVIRHFRSLDMPIELVREIITATPSTQKELISGHLARMETQLERTRSAVASLRDLLESNNHHGPIELRHVPAFPALVIRQTIDLDELGDWYAASSEKLDLNAGDRRKGPRGGMWSTELFADERGEAALYVPTAELLVDSNLTPGIRPELVPAADLAIVTNRGPDRTMAQAYANLGKYVARHELGIPGAVRESYLDDEVTEIGWPISGSAPRTT